MPTKQELQNKIEELKATTLQMQAQIDAMPDDKEEVGRVALNSDEAKYNLCGDGHIGNCRVSEYLKRGNCFTNREAAERQEWTRIHRQKARKLMAADWDGEVVDWENKEQRKNFITVNGESGFGEYWHFLSFKTVEVRDAFASNYTKEQLIMLSRGE